MLSNKEIKKLMEYHTLSARDYAKYNIKEIVEKLVSQPGVSPEILLEEINKLPHEGYIKAMKQVVQLLYDNGQLNTHNLVAVTNKENFNGSKSVYSQFRHLNTANLLTQENIDWILNSHLSNGKQALEIELLAKNNQLTESNLKAYKSGKIKDLFGCQLITSPYKPEDAVLNSRIIDRINDCGQASAILGFNAFEPNLDTKMRVMVINDINNPITNTIVPNNYSDPFSALLTFTFLLQIFKGANFFPISFKNAPNPASDPLTQIEDNLKEAFKRYRDMDEGVNFEKAIAPGLHKSCFFWRNKEQQENKQLEKPTTTPKPLR